MNKLQPDSIPKYATSGGDFKFRENISLFRKNFSQDYSNRRSLLELLQKMLLVLMV